MVSLAKILACSTSHDQYKSNLSYLSKKNKLKMFLPLGVCNDWLLILYSLTLIKIMDANIGLFSFQMKNFKKSKIIYLPKDSSLVLIVLAVNCLCHESSLYLLISTWVAFLYISLWLFSFSPFFWLLFSQLLCTWSSCTHLLSSQVTLPFRATLQETVLSLEGFLKRQENPLSCC